MNGFCGYGTSKKEAKSNRGQGTQVPLRIYRPGHPFHLSEKEFIEIDVVL